MTRIEEITGTIRHSDDKVSAFRIARPSYDVAGWHQWGNTTEVHGRTVDLMEAMVAVVNGRSEDDELRLNPEDKEIVLEALRSHHETLLGQMGDHQEPIANEEILAEAEACAELRQRMLSR